MTSKQELNLTPTAAGSRMNAIRKLNLRPYVTGILPLFIFAHFGHHVVGAIMRPILPMIRTDLNLTYTQAGWMMSAFSMTNGIAQLPAGWLADRFGARLMVLLGVTGVAITGFFLGFSHSFTWLVVFLIASAIMGGGYHPAAAAAISSSVPAEDRGRALGIHLIGGTSSFWIVPLLAAPIAAVWDWRASYLILTIPTMVLGILLYTLIGRRSQGKIQPEQPHPEEPDQAIPETSARVNWQALTPFIILSVATGTMIMSISSYLSLYAVDELGLSPEVAALLMAVTPAVGVFGAPFGGYLSDRFGGIRVMLVLSVLAIPLVYLQGVSPNAAVLTIMMLAVGLVTNTRMPTSESYIAGATPANRRATVLGLYFFAGTEVSGVLTPLVGKLIESYGFQTTFLYSALATGAIVLICALFLWRYRTK